MRIKTTELIHHALDYAVGKVMKVDSKLRIKKDGLYYKDIDDNLTPWHPSADIGHGGRIAFARKVMFHPVPEGWACRYKGALVKHRDPMVAAMRVICIAELPEEVCIPFDIAEADLEAA